MKNLISKHLGEKPLIEYGLIFFSLGIFFLPSTLFISILFLLPSAILGSFLQKKTYINDKWNYPFLIFGCLIILSSLLQNYVLINNYKDIWEPINSLIGLGNWIPFIYFFWSLQPFVDSKSKRRSFALILIAGTLPLLISGFGQYFFNWTGPMEALNGLIIWYQRPIENPGGLSGIFSNQNYAGSWLNFVWPFCLAVCLEKRRNLLKKTIAFCFLIGTGFAAFLTYSRNTWIGLFLSLPIVIGRRGIKFLYMLIIIFLFVFFFILSKNLTGDIHNNLRTLIPTRILLEFSEDGYQGLDATRIEIYASAINLIKTNPFFGIGAASFTQIYFLETNFWKGHTHNLLMELALSYGLPAAIIFFITTTLILFLSFQEIFKNKNKESISLFDKAFWGALFIFLISQLFDVQYFDGKLSIIMWILLAGLKNIIEDKNNKNVTPINS